MAATKSTSRRKTASKTTTRRPAQRRAQAARREAQGSNPVTLGAIAMGAAAALGAAAYGIFTLLGRKRGDGTVPTDLMGDAHPDGSERAIEAFRPDPTAPVPASERDQFRPALAGASAPTLVRGEARELDRLDAQPS